MSGLPARGRASGSCLRPQDEPDTLSGRARCCPTVKYNRVGESTLFALPTLRE